LEQIQAEIEHLRKQLEQARIDKKNYEEELAFIKKLNTYSTRSELEQYVFLFVITVALLITCDYYREIDKVNEEIARIDQESKRLTERIEQRSKQLQAIIASIKQFVADTDAITNEDKVKESALKR